MKNMRIKAIVKIQVKNAYFEGLNEKIRDVI